MSGQKVNTQVQVHVDEAADKVQVQADNMELDRTWATSLFCGWRQFGCEELVSVSVLAPCVAADIDVAVLGLQGRDHTFLVDMLTVMVTVALVAPSAICCTAWGAFSAALTMQRRDLRATSGIQGSVVTDCLAAFICPHFVTCQHLAQLRSNAPKGDECSAVLAAQPAYKLVN